MRIKNQVFEIQDLETKFWNSSLGKEGMIVGNQGLVVKFWTSSFGDHVFQIQFIHVLRFNFLAINFGNQFLDTKYCMSNFQI